MGVVIIITLINSPEGFLSGVGVGGLYMYNSLFSQEWRAGGCITVLSLRSGGSGGLYMYNSPFYQEKGGGCLYNSPFYQEWGSGEVVHV